MAHVVMISAGFYPYVVGGAERQALELSVALAKRGHRITVLTRRLPGLPPSDVVRGIRVERIGGPSALEFMVAVYRWLRAHDHDVAHAHLAGSPAIAAALAGRKAVVKLGGGKGIGELAVSSRTLSGRLKLAVLARLRPRFVYVAAELAEEARRFLGDVPLTHIPNGVDVERFSPPPEGRSGPVTFMYAGRLSPEKRLPEFLRAAGVPVTVVGEGPVPVPGASPPVDDLVPVYRRHHVFVLPSVSEGLSNALLEAMACGLCPLASRVGGTAEAVEHEKSGLLFDDLSEVPALVKRLVSEPGLAERLGAEARRRVVERYSLAGVAERYERLYLS